MDNASEKTPLVGIIMGSKSDMPVMEGCTAELDALGVQMCIRDSIRPPRPSNRDGPMTWTGFQNPHRRIHIRSAPR